MAAGPYDVLIVAQDGRLAAEALLFAASLRQNDPGFAARGGRLVVAEPQPGPEWPADPRLGTEVRAALAGLGAVMLPFRARRFGARYPNANKAEALAALPPGRPVVAFDTDTAILGPLSGVAFDFARPAASLRREDTWPKPLGGGPPRAEIWRALYDRFGLDMDPTLDLSRPEGDWRRHLYLNAGWTFAADAPAFGRRWLDLMTAIAADPPPELDGQALLPWLDQIALPLLLAGVGGGRPGAGLAGLDGDVTCHWRVLPLAYARESDAAVAAIEAAARDPRVRPLLERHEPAARMIFGGEGARARALFDRSALPPGEAAIRRRLRAVGLWTR